MRIGFAWRLAARELRSSTRRLGLYLVAVALGVAALVSLTSLRANLIDSVRGEAASILGADLRLRSSSPLPRPVRALVDSLISAGAEESVVTRLPSMVLAPASGVARLLQLYAVEGRYPFYGEFRTEPSGLWPLDRSLRRVLVDPPVLTQLGIEIGDSVMIGDLGFEVAGVVSSGGIEVGLQSAIGPRVYLPGPYLGATGLIRTGSLVEYQSYLRLSGDPDRFTRDHRDLLSENRVSVQSAQGQIERLVTTIGTLGSFLSLVGLAAVLLGGIAVASAIHLFIGERLRSVAVLRCLGATGREVLMVYLIQTTLLGLGGALIGVGAGLIFQAILPHLLAGVLPIEVEFAVHWPAIGAGLALGPWVAVVFALLPLSRVREVVPIDALRSGIGGRRRGASDPWRLISYLTIGATVVALSLLLSPGWRVGLTFSLSIGIVLGLLYLLARSLAWVARRTIPRRAPFPLRQGLSNLFRPRNQTVPITLALGFGVFLLSVIGLAQRSILDHLRVDSAGGRPNLLLFDLQVDQRDGVLERVLAWSDPDPLVSPLVPGRIAAVRGREVSELLVGEGEGRPGRWALRREYRNTYRAELASTERVVAGAWWGDEVDRGLEEPARGVGRISLEGALAEELGVGIGDRVTWDLQGVRIETEVASLREVDWAEFAPNFFVVFEPGLLESAPQSLIILARVGSAEARGELQRELVVAYPNISVLDLSQVQVVVEEVVGRVSTAVRSMALFAVGVGIIVLIGALRASRVQRLRESALLRTLGASRYQVRIILLVEYLALGTLAGLAGTTFASAAAWPLVRVIFGLDYQIPLSWPGIASALTGLVSASIGALSERGLLSRPPLAVLREGS